MPPYTTTSAATDGNSRAGTKTPPANYNTRHARAVESKKTENRPLTCASKSRRNFGEEMSKAAKVAKFPPAQTTQNKQS